MDVLTDAQVRRTRAVANGLDRPVRDPGPAGVTEVVRRTGGLQAQTWTAAALAVRSRSTATLWRDVDSARIDDRSVVRSWFHRGTIHLVATEDLGWLRVALQPMVDALSRRQRYTDLGLDRSTRERARRLLVRTLTARGPMTRAEISETLAGLVADPAGQAVPHVIRDAALHHEVCFGPDRGSKPTWVTTTDWLPGSVEPVSREVALAELCGRYLAAYGPAGPADLAAWSGLSLPDARAAFATRRDLVEVSVAGQPAARLASQAIVDEPGAARLLGEFDTYLLGHTDRGLVLGEAHRRRIHPGGGILRPAVARPDGAIAGTWRFVRRTGSADVELFDAGTIDQRQLASEVADVARFSA